MRFPKWFVWWLKHRKHRHHNPRPFRHPRPNLAHRITDYAERSLGYRGQMVYTESAARSELFHRKPGHFGGAHADCSQYVASILHWLGVPGMTDTDYTGTLLQKGKLVQEGGLGRVCIYGPGTGSHAAIDVGGGYTIGFGDQPGPDKVLQTDMVAYFERAGEPGVRWLDFT